MIMVIYRGWKFVLLGFKRWKVWCPPWTNQPDFDIILRDGVKELKARVDHWMEVIDGNN